MVRLAQMMQSIEHGHANCLTLELATVAYWYQTLPSKPFPALPSADDRKPKPEIGAVDIHVQRYGWRKDRAGERWGNERD